MMEFERKGNGHHTAIFEVIKEAKWHEQFVAAKALGSLTAKNRSDKEARKKSAYLGARISCLDASTGENGESKPIESKTIISKSDAEILIAALSEFVDDTPVAIRALNTTDPNACNLRAVEGDIAEKMLHQVSKEYELAVPTAETSPAGFK